MQQIEKAMVLRDRGYTQSDFSELLESIHVSDSILDLKNSYPRIFENVIRFDELRKYPIRSDIPRNVTGLNDLFEFPDIYNKLINFKRTFIHWKILGYTFEEIQNIVSGNSTVSIKFWMNKSATHSLASKIAFDHWENSKVEADRIFEFNSNLTLDFWIERGYNVDEAHEKLKDRMNLFHESTKKGRKKKIESGTFVNNVFGIEYWLKKGLNEEEAKLEISRRKKESLQHSPRRIEYWLKKGLNEEEAKIAVSEFQSKSASSLISKMKDNGTHRESSVRCVEFWIKKGLSEEDALKEVSRIQATFSKEKCIMKFGEEEGIKVWNDRQDRWKNSLNSNSREFLDDMNSRKDSASIEWALKKTNGDHEKSIELRNDLILKRMSGCKFYSKESEKYFKILVEFAESLGLEVFHGENEYFLKHDKNIFFYDFCIPELNLIIEYHGIFWHPRGDQKEWKSIVSYEEAFNKDELKKRIAESVGFDYHVVWSDSAPNPSVFEDIINEKIRNQIA